MPPLPYLAAAWLLSGSLAAYGADMRFAYINTSRIYSESQAARRIEAALQQEFAPLQQQLAQVQRQSAGLQQQLDNGKIRPTERGNVEQKLAELLRRRRLLRLRLSEEYNLRRNEEFAALQQRAQRLIRRLAEQEGYDLIVQEAIFVRGHYDITDRVIRLLDTP